MKALGKFRLVGILILVIIMLVVSTLPLPLSMVYPVNAGKFGDIVPTDLELQLLDKINENRTDNGAGHVKLNASLCWVARAHSQDMIDHDFFDHTSSEEGPFQGATFSERINDYAEYANPYVGEVIAFTSWGIDVEWVMYSWKNSPSHWNIIKDPNFQEIGVGLLEGEFNGTPNAGLHTVVFGGGTVSVDLAVDEVDIAFTPSEPSEGQDVNISATIHNLGLTDAYPVNVRFYDGDPDSEGLQIGQEQQIQHILVHGESATAKMIWNTEGKAGSHDIYMVVDGENIIAETNEGNNKAFKILVVNATFPPIHLNDGWNLVSFPHLVSNKSLESVLSSIEGKYDYIWTYNSTDTMDSWKHYHVSKPIHMNNLHDMDNTIGFWVHIMNVDGAELMINGEEPAVSQYIHLNTGWNLVGYPSTTEKVRAEALNNLVFGNEVDVIQCYDNATGTIKNSGEGQNMEPGKGYWLHATRDCEWIVIN